MGSLKIKPEAASFTHKTASHFEELIVKEAKRTGFRYRRLTGYLRKKLSLRFPDRYGQGDPQTQRGEEKDQKTANARRRPLYDYEALMPFQELQLDTKHILDKDALPAEVYAHITHYRLPLFEWNIIDVSTRIRFTAYSYELSSAFAIMFLSIVLLWLRTIISETRSAFASTMAESSAEDPNRSLTCGMSTCLGSMPHFIPSPRSKTPSGNVETLTRPTMSTSLSYMLNAAGQPISSS